MKIVFAGLLFFSILSCGSFYRMNEDEKDRFDTLHVVDTIICGEDTIYVDTVYYGKDMYRNPIIKLSLPDPSVIKASDGYFYLYATEDTRNMPIYKSKNLVDWEFVGTVFSDETRPDFLKDGHLWAPNININDGVFTLFYSLSLWGERHKNGVGIALANSPSGPFYDFGKLFTSSEIGVDNAIDPFYFEERGSKYLFVGGLHGIYAIELSEDCRSIKKGAKPVKIMGNGVEGSYIYKRGDYYYFFGSQGNCCQGVNSNYRVVYGRSTDLLGPYVAKDGKKLLDSHYEVLLQGNSYVAGPGHNARFVTDDGGQDWVLYHGYLKAEPSYGRVLFLDPIYWKDDWPYIRSCSPSEKGIAPKFYCDIE